MHKSVNTFWEKPEGEILGSVDSHLYGYVSAVLYQVQKQMDMSVFQ